MKKFKPTLGRASLFILTAFLLMLSNFAFAQNITNAGFDVITTCPTSWPSYINEPTVDYATGWKQSTHGTSDLYNTCGSFLYKPNGTTLAPQNGTGYAGVYAESSGYDSKEYLTNELSAPLVAGVTYTVSFYMAQTLGASNLPTSHVGLANSEKGFFGLCFSTISPTQNDTHTDYGLAASIKNSFAPNGRVYIPANHPAYTSNNTWVPVTLQYTATGGEKFMTVGQFRPGPSIGTGRSYYLVDGFSSTAQAECNAGSTAPSVQNISNICPSTTANLNTAHTGTTPAGTDLVWFNTNNPSTGTQLTATQVANAVAGTYYAFYKSTTVTNCYSPASNAVTVTINSCVVCNAGTTQVPLNGSTLFN